MNKQQYQNSDLFIKNYYSYKFQLTYNIIQIIYFLDHFIP